MSLDSGPQPNVTVLVGAQWGDEGKGKWIDVLAHDADLVVRYQGGNNAGHTLYVDGQKVVLHQLPSGVFHPEQQSAMAAGVVVNPGQLLAEIDRLGSRVQLTPERLWMSGRAHVITPWHIHLDEQRESSDQPIGTTKRGIGPTYSEKAARSGLRLGHFVDDQARERWLERHMAASPEFRRHVEANADAWTAFAAAAVRLRPFVCDAEAKIRKAAKAGRRLLLEGAQGTLLDLDHGTYPYVTSSSTGAGGAVAGIGLSPRLIGRVVGIAKCYVTRVGEGPFPTELHDAVGKDIATRGNEFGATTGRPRRVGWMDAVALRYVADVSGLDGVVLNKIDILSGVKELKIAVAYRHPRLGRLDELPWDTEVLAECEPIYETYPGFDGTVPLTGRIADLPENARRFIDAIERHGGVKVLAVGTGPHRTDALYP
jgi:adenylosuccinate synthase